MFQPGLHDEVETYVGYLQTQIDSLREAAYGLTEEEARLTPCRSALSIGGLLKHATFVLDGRAPVSYTHLDVYKRQAPGSPGRAVAPRRGARCAP